MQFPAASNLYLEAQTSHFSCLNAVVVEFVELIVVVVVVIVVAVSITRQPSQNSGQEMQLPFLMLKTYPVSQLGTGMQELVAGLI